MKDYGELALTAAVTVLVSIVDSAQALKTSWWAFVGATMPEASLTDVHMYLTIASCAVPILLVLFFKIFFPVGALKTAVHSGAWVLLGLGNRLVWFSAVGSWLNWPQRRQQSCCGMVPCNQDCMSFNSNLLLKFFN